jgi:thiamine-phosphate pyrophosphorylase
VHLGQDDLSPADVGPLLGASSIVGLSTHTSAQLAAALDSCVDYVAMGPVYATTTKARPDPVVGLVGVRQAAALAARASRPLVAIGGLAVDRAAAVLDAGAQSLAVASGLLDPDPRSAARRWLDAVGLQARRPR